MIIIRKISFILVAFSRMSYADSGADDAMSLIDNSISQTYGAISAIEYNSNPLLSDSDERSVWISKFLPYYKAQLEDDNDQKYIDLGLTVHRTTDTALSVNRQDPRVMIGWDHQFSKGSLGANLSFSRRATRATEVDISGEITDNASTLTRAVTLSGLYAFTERVAADVSISFNDINYDGATVLQGYKTGRLNTGFTYELSDNLTAIASISETQIYRDSADSQIFGTLVGANWKPQNSLLFSFSFGLNRTTIEGLPSDTSPAFNISANYDREKDSFTSAMSKTVVPSGLNGPIKKDKFSIGWKHLFNEDLALQSNYALSENKSINNTKTDIFSFGLSKKISKEWSARLYYSRRESQRDAFDASANVMGVSIGYGFSDIDDNSY